MMGPGRHLAALAAIGSLLLVSVVKAEEAPGTYRRVPLGPGKHEYEVTVARGSATTLLFPRDTDCSAAIGDARYFGFVPSGNRVVVTANTQDLNRTTNVSLRCGDIDMNIVVRMSPPGPYSGLMVDFQRDEAQERRVVEQVSNAREDEKRVCRTEKEATAELVHRQQRDQFLIDMASRSSVSTDREHGRNGDSLIVHVDHAVTVGSESYVRFTIENGTRAVVNLGEVQLYTESTNAPVHPLAYQPRQLSIGVEQSAGVAVRFTTPLALGKLRLVVKDTMGRLVEVDDIKL